MVKIVIIVRVKKHFYTLTTLLFCLVLQIAIAADFVAVKNYRYEMTEEAAKNLRHFNSSATCENWKESFMESLIGKSFKSSEQKREATTKVEGVIKEVTRVWDLHFSEDSKGPAHQEMFVLSFLKKDTNESYKKFYERKYNESIESLKKLKEQTFNNTTSNNFKEVNEEYRNEFEKRIEIANFLKAYAMSANKAVDAKKATWAFVLKQVQNDHPDWDQKYLSKIVQGISSFNQSIETLCPVEVIRKALLPDEVHQGSDSMPIKK